MGNEIQQSSIEALMRARRSIRAFEDEPVPLETIEALLRTAGRAPSNSNTQPWKVDVLVGDAKRSLTRAIMEEHVRDRSMPSAHFPFTLPTEHRDRQIAFGALFYGAYGIARGDAEAVERQLASNYDFYGAPVGMILSIDGNLLKHSWLDCGLFLQSLMLEAAARGFGTCAQVVFARHEATIARELHFPADRAVVCGLSLGRASPSVEINEVDYAREALSSFCTFHGYGELTAQPARASDA